MANEQDDRNQNQNQEKQNEQNQEKQNEQNSGCRRRVELVDGTPRLFASLFRSPEPWSNYFVRHASSVA